MFVGRLDFLGSSTKVVGTSFWDDSDGKVKFFLGGETSASWCLGSGQMGRKCESVILGIHLYLFFIIPLDNKGC